MKLRRFHLQLYSKKIWSVVLVDRTAKNHQAEVLQQFQFAGMQSNIQFWLVIMIVDVGLNDRHCKVSIDVTSQKDIKSETKSIVITCWFLVWGTWRLSHCIKFYSRSCTWYVSNDLCVHDCIKCMLCTLEHLVNVLVSPYKVQNGYLFQPFLAVCLHSNIYYHLL